MISVESDALEEQVIHRMEELGLKETWPERYHKDFEVIVQQKLATARLGFDSHIVVSEEPWLLEEECSLFQGAAVPPSGKLRVATSGAYGTTDYRCAKIILEVIGALCSIKIVKLEEANQHAV